MESDIKLKAFLSYYTDLIFTVVGINTILTIF